MKGRIKKIELVERTIKQGERTGQKFRQVEFTVDVDMYKNNEVRTYKGTMSTDYAVDYFQYCGLTSQDAIDRECEVVLAKRKFTSKDGEEITMSYVKYLSFYDENGDIIRMPKKDGLKLPF